MSSGLRYKWQGSRVAISTTFDSTTTDPVSAITQASPAVVTETGHGRASGDVVRLTGILGMTDLNGTINVIQVLTANTYALLGVDSTGYAAYVSGGEADGAVFSNFCELTAYNRSGGSSPEIDATTICSDAAEFELGLPDSGTTQLDYNFVPLSTIQAAMTAADKSKARIAVKITLPGNGGFMVQAGFVQQTSEQAGNGTLWTGSTTIRNTGLRYDFAAPVTP